MRKLTSILAVAGMCAGLVFGSVNAVMAEEEPVVKSTFTIDDAEVQNMTDVVIASGTIETVKDGDKEVYNVVLTDDAGKLHTYEKVDVENWKDLKYVEDYEMFYLQYTDNNGKSREAEENVDEINWEKPVTMYISGSVNIRKEPKNEADVVSFANVGEEYEVIGIAPGWFKVKIGDDTAYVYHKYLTEDKAAVEAMKQPAANASSSYSDYSGDNEYSYDYSYSDDDYSAPEVSEPTPDECLSDGLLY